jgi:biotin transport system substrate-specific component
MVLADLTYPGLAWRNAARVAKTRRTRISLWLHDAAIVLAGSALIALSAQVAIPLPFSPVPITGQTFGVLLVASLLGRSRGAAAALAYLAEGAAGLPVFAGAAAGPAVLLGPTGGYLLGFVPAAALCGALAERGWDRTGLRTAVSMILGNIVILALGLSWLARFVGAPQVLALGFWPFVPGDIVKIGLAAALLPLGWKALGARGR